MDKIAQKVCEMDLSEGWKGFFVLLLSIWANGWMWFQPAGWSPDTFTEGNPFLAHCAPTDARCVAGTGVIAADWIWNARAFGTGHRRQESKQHKELIFSVLLFWFTLPIIIFFFHYTHFGEGRLSLVLFRFFVLKIFFRKIIYIYYKNISFLLGIPSWRKKWPFSAHCLIFLTFFFFFFPVRHFYLHS